MATKSNGAATPGGAQLNSTAGTPTLSPNPVQQVLNSTLPPLDVTPPDSSIFPKGGIGEFFNSLFETLAPQGKSGGGGAGGGAAAASAKAAVDNPEGAAEAIMKQAKGATGSGGDSGGGSPLSFIGDIIKLFA